MFNDASIPIDYLEESRMMITGGGMTQKLIVATFGNLDVAQRASRDLHNFERDDDFKIESGVMVEKTADGTLHVLTQYSEPHWGVVTGAVSGALIGLLGGPPGAIAGAVAGAGAGLAGRALEHVLDKKLTGAIELELRPGTFALILETKNPPDNEVEDVVRGYGGKVFTQSLTW
ncbi:DUF1269 domain-containing protein [Paraburkholderia sp. EG285A]|uniref:DUF1269 domain-containing protein n=1 Tax=Paraburkholderia sp. EG285A TaxID=3237009 RepID=UPI0034D2FBDE